MSSDDLCLEMDGKALVARLSGEVDLSNAEQLGERIAAATPSESVGVVLDLSDVVYLDSFGVHVLFGLRQRLAERRQVLALVVPEESPILPALQIATVSERMQVVTAVDDALRTLLQEDGAEAGGPVDPVS